MVLMIYTHTNWKELNCAMLKIALVVVQPISPDRC